MFRPSFKDWPFRHKRLLHATAAVLAVILAVLWGVVYPNWRRLQTLEDDVNTMRKRLEKKQIQLDAALLQEHIRRCNAAMEDSKEHKGLVSISNETIDMATRSFDDDIRDAYPATENSSSADLFIESSTKIDYKDLYDRVASEFSNYNVKLSQKSIEPDEENNEPVYQLMLKLWTIRNIVRAAVQNNLKVENNENDISRIHALKTVAYTIGNDDQPYLLEFSVSIRMSGTMENFLSFAKALQKDNLFMPIKTITVYSDPPGVFPPGQSTEINSLHFRTTCSAFFKAPAKMETTTADSKQEN